MVLDGWRVWWMVGECGGWLESVVDGVLEYIL
jgi:hypothetical protein